MRFPYVRILSLALSALLLAACNRNTVGICDGAVPPLITISRVQNASNSADVRIVKLDSIRFGDQPLTILTQLTGSPAHGVSVEEDKLRCDIVCGFGWVEGTYRMAVHAEGYRDTTITLNATYDRGNDSCPGAYVSGERLTLRLTPLP